MAKFFGEWGTGAWLLLVGLGVGWCCPAVAQPANSGNASPTAELDVDDEPLVADSVVGYLDNTLLGNYLRVRYDASFNVTQPARAEFFWPVDGPFGDGPGPDTSIDYQDFSLYAESMMGGDWSVFGEMPLRLINPEVQANTGGLGDSTVGVKYRLSHCGCTAWTAQLKVYIPSGDGDRGLGTDHTSLEPGILYQTELSDRTTLFAEVKDWIATDGSPNFFGNVLRYGVGAGYRIGSSTDCRPVTAVAEFVGWTVLEGRTAITTAPVVTTFADATGDTIVNGKLGFRWQLSPTASIYAGYGRVLTEQTWYDDTARLEFRRAF